MIIQNESTRDRVLKTLLTQEQCTINELAQAVDINPISVRHHITKLQSEGLVNSTEERHGVGRPRRVYFLTEQGRERFPQRYLRLTLRLLEQLKETMPQEMVDKLFTQMAEDLAKEYKDELDELPIEERLDLVMELLTNEGFTIDWEQRGDTYQIQETSCPYFHVGQDHPEVCKIDQTLISTILDVPTQKIKCKLNGDAHCIFIVPKLNSTEILVA
jgi:predicted ArsR family transcriptional regulator